MNNKMTVAQELKAINYFESLQKIAKLKAQKNLDKLMGLSLNEYKLMYRQ